MKKSIWCQFFSVFYHSELNLFVFWIFGLGETEGYSSLFCRLIDGKCNQLIEKTIVRLYDNENYCWLRPWLIVFYSIIQSRVSRVHSDVFKYLILSNSPKISLENRGCSAFLHIHFLLNDQWEFKSLLNGRKTPFVSYSFLNITDSDSPPSHVDGNLISLEILNKMS